MRLLITGHSGFIGQHLLQALSINLPPGLISNIITPSRDEVDLESKGAANKIIEVFQPTHVLHLAWAMTSEKNYDQGHSHAEWSKRTLLLARELSEVGIISWVVGTGLEHYGFNENLSPYGLAKLKLKKDIIDLDSPLCRWISMPFIFSLFHQRPRLMKSCLQGEPLAFPDMEQDYLDVRDVAVQLKNIICNSSYQVSSISSFKRTANSIVCSQISSKKNDTLLNSCSCQDSGQLLLSATDTFFTEMLLY
jgi:hypothetical protein